jgi:uncharacterized protein (DUF2252 family)
VATSTRDGAELPALSHPVEPSAPPADQAAPPPDPSTGQRDLTARLWPDPGGDAAELSSLGRQARHRLRRSDPNVMHLAPDRDPLGILAAQDTTRVAHLVPLRHERMAVSAFTFFRGAAAVMTADLASGPSTGLHVQLCGDAHLANFGAFATPERSLVFDVNDFDETLPGPFEWDLKRLAASVVVAADDLGFAPDLGRQAALESARSYQRWMGELAAMGELDRWYAQLDIAELLPHLPDAQRHRAERSVAKARKRTALQAVSKLTTLVDGQLRIADDPPVIEHLDDTLVHQHLANLVHAYRDTLSGDRRHLLDRFRVVDVARKVVGVGSVGTRCYLLLMEAPSDGGHLFLQVKEAQPSVLEAHLGPAAETTHGERVVVGQRLMQAASDIFLGWTTAGPYHFYVRQLRDMKGSVDFEGMTPAGLTTYARVCGLALARSHARSGAARAVAAYLGSGSSFAEAIAEFAVTYAEVNRADYRRFLDMVTTSAVTSQHPELG